MDAFLRKFAVNATFVAIVFVNLCMLVYMVHLIIVLGLRRNGWKKSKEAVQKLQHAPMVERLRTTESNENNHQCLVRIMLIL